MDLNGLLGIIAVLLVVGLILWAVTALPMIDATIKRIIQIIVIVVAGLWVIGLLFGRFGGAHILK